MYSCGELLVKSVKKAEIEKLEYLFVALPFKFLAPNLIKTPSELWIFLLQQWSEQEFDVTKCWPRISALPTLSPTRWWF